MYFTYLDNTVYYTADDKIDFGIVCFDKNKSIYMYNKKPIKEDSIWYIGSKSTVFYICSPKNNFVTNVSWEDSMRFYVRKDDSYAEVSEEEFNLVKAILNQ